MCKRHLVIAILLLSACGCQQEAEKPKASPPSNAPATKTGSTPAVGSTAATETKQTPEATKDQTAQKNSPPAAKPDDAAIPKEDPAKSAPAGEAAPRKVAIVRRPPRKAPPADGPKAAATPPAPPKMPVLLLTEEHAATCLVKVGDVLPDASLPDLDGEVRKVSSLRGERLTVVFFWSCTDRHSLQQLEDMGPDVESPFEAQGVQVIGIDVRDDETLARNTAGKIAPDYPVLLDTKGTYFNQISTGATPRTLLLDKDGKIVWLDIEYTRITRRQLQEAILFLLQEGKQAAKAAAG